MLGEADRATKGWGIIKKGNLEKVWTGAQYVGKWGFLGRDIGGAADWALFSVLGKMKGWVVGRGHLHRSPFSFRFLDVSFSLLVNTCF